MQNKNAAKVQGLPLFFDSVQACNLQNKGEVRVCLTALCCHFSTDDS